MLATITPSNIRGAELIGALSHALDLTEGQPRGHCHRVCWLGMKLGQAIGLSKAELSDLYYGLLLKDLGCSSNAARICQLYLANDITFKADFKLIDGSLSQALRFVLTHTGLESGMAERFRAIMNILRNGGEIARDLIEARCHRGAEIAGRMGFGSKVAAIIQNLDEHWNGEGKPEAKLEDAIPLGSQIALLAQVADVFFISRGRDAATAEIIARAGTWFDPALAASFDKIAHDDDLWSPLQSPDLAQRILDLEPAEYIRIADEDYLDHIAEGFAMVVDSKSPFTAGHSERVALYTDLIAEQMGFSAERRRWLRRAALLHDLGKLAISNTVLDKPSKLSPSELEAMRSHSRISGEILSGIPAFRDIVAIAAGHHERLDGQGYPYGLKGDQISLETRIVTAADFFDALTADRPYRKAAPISEALSLMERDLGKAFDPACYQALVKALQASALLAA